MHKVVTARRAGGSVTIAIPVEMAKRLAIKPGDELWAIEQGGGILITPRDPDLDSTLREFDRSGAPYERLIAAMEDE